MVVVGFDADIARANGFTVATRPDGTLYRVEDPVPSTPVPASQLSLPSAVRPENVVTGNCGSSFVELYDVGVRRYHVSTGFGVVSPAVGYTWSTNVIAPSAADNYTHRWHGVLWGNYAFQMDGYADIRAGSWTTAKATGWTTHVNGDICQSLGPISSISVY